ncbi:hydroxymethylglutaryl-CoA lyase [Starkeya sp. ORNL1]|uniref:hydroxymethylglutaryl-CoA lyase n=1 Tax=Starkeya sp. ORNL1 TaxID=2709380 RepID=UPI0014642D3F|nr:hydroxymethylglutaryl-CoA lyase [Starkeya sp. ORNL1]QJP16035.1 hydroxymethylglutaryl-CoA lyase [Starkeya sp. ORNL1]
MGERVTVTEVGPRDGLQMAKSIMPTDAKVAWIKALVAAGIHEIEVGSFVPPKLIPQMADTGDVVRAGLEIPGLRIVALVPNLKGAQRAYEAGAHVVTVPVSVSEGHSRANTNKGSLDQVAEVRAIREWLDAQERKVKLDAGCVTAFGCSIEGNVPESRVVMIAAALADAGVDGILLADTVGYGNPAQIRSVVRAVQREVGEKLERLHLHDTMGLGIANALAGLDEGIRCFDSALAGLGGCPFAPGASGNIVTEDLVFMLESMGFDTGIDLDRLIAAREALHRGLPDAELLGNVVKAGIPRTYRRAA